MKKVLKMSVVSGFIFVSTFVVYAQDGTANTPTTTEGGVPIRVEGYGESKPVPPIRPSVMAPVRPDVMEERKEIRMETRNTIGGLRDGARKEISKTREEFRVEMKEKADEVKVRIDQKRDELKKKLSVIKDERKKELVLTINDKFQALNKKAVERLGESMNRQEDAIKKLKERMTNPAFSNQNNTAINTQIANAEAKIAEVRSKLSTQSGKVYTINVTTEASLKANTEAQRLALKADITAIQDSIKSISELIRSAAKDLALIK